MRHVKLFLFLIIAVIGISVSSARGQDGPPPEDGGRDDRPNIHRPNLLAELGLSQEQVQQIRRMNQARRPLMIEARRRMGEAMRNLDMAIYGDNVSDADFQARLKEFQAAEAELSRLRFESEMSVRKVLTPEQLVRFRELRRSFAEKRKQDGEDRRRRMPPMQEGPFRRPIND